MMRWLDLTVSEPDSRRRIVSISISKKTVPLATRRNRIRRLLREAVGQDPRFADPNVYSFRVLKPPDKLTFQAAKKAVHELQI